MAVPEPAKVSERDRLEGAERPWHARPVEDVLAALESTPDGLSSAEAERRLARHGRNRLAQAKGRGALARFLAQFHNVLIYVLLGAAAVTALLQHWIDTGVILGVVVINAVIGFIQEGKAERALDAIRGMLSLSAHVIRDGRRRQVAAETLVPGDVVFLQSGDKVPADLRLLKVKNLQIQEAALTGESVAVEKASAPVEADTELGDRRSMAYSGTLVTYGQATGVVVATGAATEIGRISEMIAEVEPITTPLLRQMAVFGRWLTVAILGLTAVTFAFGLLVRDYAATEMFLAAVGLAVAAIPEGLPAIMTITLAIGVERMAGRNAIIRRLPAVETLGAVTVICTDKTGTLTRNEMTVRSLVAGGAVFEVTGSGYAPEGAIHHHGEPAGIAGHRPLERLLEGAVLCSDTLLELKNEHWSIDGDPTEGALVSLAMKGGLDADHLRENRPRLDQIPFESEHRFMATLIEDGAGRRVYVKGAPERLLAMCAEELRADGTTAPLDVEAWHEWMAEVTVKGERALALATAEAPPDRDELAFADVEHGLTLIGLVGLADPPRAEAIDAVAACRRAGVNVKMITGDHAGTAAAIGRQLGLGETTLAGAEIDRLDDDALRRRVGEVDVFARASPEHKLRLVKALQAEGAVTAMTGDGVNDAPALKRSDVGIAMGEKGTEAAKEAAEMVLADDNFATIAAAIEEGRTIYDNLVKAITFILPTNGAQALVIIGAILAGTVLPITPVQILWVNMVTAVTLALALAFEPPEKDIMRRPPRRPDEPLLSPFLLWRIGFVALLLLAGTMATFYGQRTAGAEIEQARTAAVNALVVFEAFYLFNARRLRRGVVDREGFLGSRAVLISVTLVLVFQLVFTYAPFMQVLFDTRPIGALTWLAIVAAGAAIFAVIEVEKAIVAPRLSRKRRAVDAQAT